MRKHIVIVFALTVLVPVLLLGGCGSSNKEGQPASLSTVITGTASQDNNIQVEITGVVISSPPVVTFKLLDEKGAPLDPATAGLNIRFYIAQLQANGNYANYFGDASNYPTYDTAGTSASVGSGAYTYTFSRDITTTANLAGLLYDAAKTHTVAIQVYRSVTDDYGKTFQQARNVYFNFRPDGGAVTQTREIAATSNCNECHGKLSLHGGSRREVALCILCHNPGLTVNGVSFDFKVMVHKIHMGEKLPGNVAAIALGGSGFSIGSANYAEVAYPFISGDSQVTTRPIECTKCHKAGQDINGRAFGTDVDKWKGTAKIENCITCHDTTAFNLGQTTSGINVANADLVAGEYTPKLTSVTAVPHTGGLIWTDAVCRACHVSELAGDNAYKMSIVGHHTVFEKSSLFTGLNFQILSLTNATPGNMPTVTFKITDDAGNSLSPAEAGSSYSLKLGYFTASDYTNEGMNNYGQPLSQALAGATANPDGSDTITFAAAIPANATGTGVIGMEGRRTYNIPATDKYAARTISAGGKSVQYYFDLATGIQVTDPSRKRRVSVDTEKCNACHGRLSLHGGSRTDVPQCVICHNPNATDRSDDVSATAGARSVTKDGLGNITGYNIGLDGLFSQSIQFKVMIHKIHTGEALDVSKNNANGFVGYYIENSANDFSKVRYPRDRRDCLACHVTKDPLSYGLPLPDGVLGATTLTGATIAGGVTTFTSTIQPPITAACVSCHDTTFAIGHAAGHVTGSGAAAVEGCAACHKPGLLQGIDFAHKPVR
ncbi:MAG: OmcA/MtrC family decaheme c-type cytochrome [Thermodesulfobacteriota bacterium]